MLDSGGGGGYGGTNWSGMSMIDMWMTLQNQDTTPHWELVDGWRKSYELTLQHISAVRSYRENLAAAWPPEKSRASAAYIDRLDGLLEHLQETYDAAIANHSTFSNATLAISSSRTELETVVTEYLANEARLVDYEQAKEAAQVPVGEDNLPRPTPTNPVAEGRQAQLETRARAIMSSLSRDLIQARSQLQQPARYRPMQIDDGHADSGEPTYVPPPIPPIAVFDPDGSASSIGSPSGHVQPASTPSTVTAGGAGGRLPGLVLGGNQPPVAGPLPPPPASSPIIGTPPGSGSISPIGPLVPGGLGGSRAGSARSGLPSGSTRATPPGGLIGGTGAPGRNTPVSGRLPSNVNPVGGVISPNAPMGTQSSSRQGTAPFTPMGQRPQDPEKDGQASQRWDPDNPWQTAKGVDPILQPAEEPPIDPGPAIGLS